MAWRSCSVWKSAAAWLGDSFWVLRGVGLFVGRLSILVWAASGVPPEQSRFWVPYPLGDRVKAIGQRPKGPQPWLAER